MNCHVVFRDLSGVWETDLTETRPLTCREAARAALEQTGRDPSRELRSVIYMKDGERVEPDSFLSDGSSLSVYVLLGGG